MINKSGQHNFKGINFQTLAAMSLFLQYLREPDFNYIQLEDPKWADFTLIFKDGHKIICESKNYANGLQDNHIRKIIEKINLRSEEINNNDEILIICSNHTTKTAEEIQTYKYWPEKFKEHFLNKGYSESQLDSLSKVKIWKVSSNLNTSIIYSLLNELIGFWLPKDDLEKTANSVLFSYFYKGSETGNVFSREDIINEIKSEANRAIKKSSRFNEDIFQRDEQINHIISDVKGMKNKSGQSDLSALSQNPQLMFFLLERLEKEKSLKLESWDQVWQSSKASMYPHKMFNIFEKNMESEKNRNYVLDFLIGNIEELDTYYGVSFLESDITQILKKATEADNKSHKKIFSIIEKQIRMRGTDIFFLKNKRDIRHKEKELSQMLATFFMEVNDDLKQMIYKFITDVFNLVEDDGDYSHYTPRPIFRIIREYLTDGDNVILEKRLLSLTETLSDQYNQFYKKYNLKFKGWEHIGGSGTSWGSNYHISDRHFILDILTQALENLDDKTKWDFVKNNFITTTKNVSSKRPDFLNRSAIPIILNEFDKGNQDSFPILQEFILSRRGIPNKAELIYQEVSSTKFSSDQKWQLVKIATEKYSEPINYFVETITADLAANGHEEAQKQIKSWISSENYYKKNTGFKVNVIESISKVLMDSVPSAIELFDEFVSSQYFIDEFDNFDVYDVSKLFANLIEKNSNLGWKIWDEINGNTVLSSNQQTLLAYTLANLADKESNHLKNIAFTKMGELTENYIDFIKKYDNKFARQEILQFIEKLAKVKQGYDPDKCFKIAKRFLIDPDPLIENDKDDIEGEFNYHQQIKDGKNPIVITSVRGRIPWVMQQIIRPGIEENIGEVIDLVDLLITDENLYVRMQAWVALSRLLQIRNTIHENKRFIEEKYSKKVEQIAFNMLNDKENSKPAIQEIMARSFNYLRLIDYDQAVEACEYFIKADGEALREYLHVIIYFAEFTETFNKTQKKVFKSMLFDLIKTKSEIESQIAWHMWKISSPEEEGTYLNKAIPYVDLITEEYDHDSFERIYEIIRENIDDPSNQKYLLGVYEKCLNKEIDYLEKNSLSIDAWHGYFWHGDILLKIYNIDKPSFVSLFKRLVDYPVNYAIGNIEKVTELLNELPDTKEYNDDISYILTELVNVNPNYYDQKKSWEKKKKK